jgi:formylglycine-generating enzyme required for sulfatase activity
MSAAAASQREPPKVPNHEMIRVIGRGSYGEIWMARTELGLLRAVKIVDRRTFESDKAFQREFEGMAAFEPISREHAGFVDILHVGRDVGGEFFYYVMELADDHLDVGEICPEHYTPKTLKSELARRRRLLADEVVALGLSLCDALGALHREGLVHRDIKPANIIFVGGRPKIADIGLVAASGQNSFVGTEGYVPPEGPGSVQGDVFSLGKVLYELAMGKDRMDFPALHTGIDALPDREALLRLNTLLLRACATDPAERYSSIEELQRDLTRLRDGRAARPARRHPWRWVLAVLLGTALTAAGAYLFRIETGRGRLEVTTKPEGAMLLVGDRMVRSPGAFERLRIGAHTLRAILPGYERYERTVLIEADATLRLPPIVLARSRGGAQADSRPRGVEFELQGPDDVLLHGTLPGRWSDLPTGAYTLTARHDGREKTASFEVAAGEVAAIAIEFASGSARIESQPEGAEILVGAKPAGKAPLDLTLPEGPWTILARYRGWPQQEQRIEIAAGQTASARFEFPLGRVKITSAPSGAQVFAGAQDLGHTPLLIEHIEPGPVEYVLQTAGYEPMKVAGVVRPGEQTFLGAHFTRRAGPQPGEPWENTLGMRFVPVGGVLMAIWPTRVRDYQAFCAATARASQQPDFPQEEDHPAVLVNHEDARAFCSWLTEYERDAGRLAPGQHYRLPRDLEWSLAAGLPDEGRATPEERDGRVRDFPWGRQWPPPPGTGNFADASLRGTGQGAIAGYHDGYPQTSPVGSFAPNALGLFDISGNVWQWILEPYSPGSRWGVLRGGSWANHKPAELWSSYRNVVDPSSREVIYGFRCVLVAEAPP